MLFRANRALRTQGRPESLTFRTVNLSSLTRAACAAFSQRTPK